MGRRSELSRTSAETDFPSAATAGSRLLRALGREPKDEVDAFAELAAAICWTPHGYVTILDGNRLYFKGSYGDRLVCVPRPGTFCDHALHHDAIFIVPDTAKDPRFFPLRGVGAHLGVRFYAGVPLRSPSSEIMGVLCVLDTIPRELKAWQVRALTLLGEQVSGHLADRLKETEQGVRVPDRRHNTRREADAHFHAFFDLTPVSRGSSMQRATLWT